MISLEQITGEIAALEGEVPTHAVMQKLAALYTVRDHMILQPPAAAISEVIVPVSDSEFMRAIEGMETKQFLSVMDELMSTLIAVNPRLYESVLRKF